MLKRCVAFVFGLETIAVMKGSEKFLSQHADSWFVKSDVFKSTSEANQSSGGTAMCLQGERQMAPDNKSLGWFPASRGSHRTAGVPQVQVSFPTSMQRLLQVSANGSNHRPSARALDSRAAPNLMRKITLCLRRPPSRRPEDAASAPSGCASTGPDPVAQAERRLRDAGPETGPYGGGAPTAGGGACPRDVQRLLSETIRWKN